jgi:hypothetical protein
MDCRAREHGMGWRIFPLASISFLASFLPSALRHQHLVLATSYFPQTICEEQQMGHSSHPTRHGPMTVEQQTRLSCHIRKISSDPQHRGEHQTGRGDDGHSLDADGRWDALLIFGCWEGGTERKKFKDIQYLACNGALWASGKQNF